MGWKNLKIFKKYFGYNVALTIVINIVIGFSMAGIDNFAHIGGLTGGFLTAYAIKVNTDSGKLRQRILALGAVLLIAYGGFYYGLHNKYNLGFYRLQLLQKQIVAGSGNPTQVEAAAETVLNLNPGNNNNLIKVAALRMIIWSEVVQHKYNPGIQHAMALKKLDAYSGRIFLGIYLC